MVGIAQLVEHWIVAPVVAGSSPVTHPTRFNNIAAWIQRNRHEEGFRRDKRCARRSFASTCNRRSSSVSKTKGGTIAGFL